MAYKVELPHILIVDDDSGVRKLLRDLLSVKYDCACAPSGQEALARIEKRPPDLVLSDIKMDDMNGLELVRKLSDSSPSTVAVMISGIGTVDSAVAAIRVGAYDFIQKPFNVTQVEMAIERALHHRRMLVEKRRYEEQLEKSGLITELGKWILREACSQGKRWRKQRVELEIAVNASPVQFNEAFGPAVRQILSDTQFDPELLNVEVTETPLLLNADTAIHGLQCLRNLGVKVSIDDFGTGYSSLRHLMILPVDVLKIDRSFVSEAIANPDDAALVTTIISLAHNLGLSVVAEGVETKEQLDFLNRMQCDYWQGYLCSRPIPPDELEALLEIK